MPVVLPPGRFKLFTKLSSTGSRTTINTMGIVVDAALAANAGGLPQPSQLRLLGVIPGQPLAREADRNGHPPNETRSRRFYLPCTRHSVVRFGIAAIGPVRAAADKLLRKPTVGIAACSECAPSGHVVSPVKKARNSRRFIVSPKAQRGIVAIQAGIPKGVCRVTS
jgi:hypothetical protein